MMTIRTLYMFSFFIFVTISFQDLLNIATHILYIQDILEYTHAQKERKKMKILKRTLLLLLP